ncbi:Lrp/AsnC family transcriptional regulator [Fodinicola acaciae]|uniref:Lrp/AsnC family transcriptional regulator n=1 Tax=Fodinicola acaciae TaxID=2681555 RepID=UPI0013D7674C|nr:Lrp/AsnC family transcriptional regulator [Fodinicola acaciae]
MTSDTYDLLDRQLLNGLLIDGRAGFSTMAEVFGVSDQTIARRYRRLRASGVRVLARLQPAMFGDTVWFIRLRCTPDAAVPIATALAKRPDTSYIKLTSGGTEINCIVHAPDDDARDALLLQKLPRTPRIVSMTAHCLIHTFYGGPQTWNGSPDALTPEQVLALVPPPVHEAEHVTLDADDRLLLAELQKDGRMSYRELAAATGMSETSARRRVEHLRRSGAMYFDVEFDPEPLGFHTTAMLWLTVSPAALASVGKAVGQHPEIAFAAATTGTSNLCAVAICRNSAHLYRYLSGTLGSLDDVRHIETAPVMRTIKQLSYD